jgi:hypothetical protein
MSNIDRVLISAGGTLFISCIALAAGYLWIRAMHYPFTPRQRKMWTYYLLFVSALPVASSLWAALSLWVMPRNQSAAFTLFLLVVWMVIAFYIVRRMSRPGGRLSREPADPN